MGWPAAIEITGLAVIGYAGWLWIVATDTADRTVPLAALLVGAALLGLASYLSSARADRRWRAVLDRYAERELAKTINSRRNMHADP